MPCTVTKIEARVFQVTGTIAVIAGKVVNEPFERCFRSRHEAEIVAERTDRQNAEALAYVAEVRAARRAAVEEYLAKRAERPASRQLSLFA